MPADLLALVGRDHEAAYGERETIAWDLLASALKSLWAETCCLTLLAGAGTRWVKSLLAAKAGLAGALEDDLGRVTSGFPLDAPRGLFPVRNFISAEPSRIPMAAYAVDALKGLGRHVIVIRGWEAEIRSEIIETLGIDEGMVSFCAQREGPSGKVLGHGDAARQSRRLWRDSRFVIANFGGDVNSPLTALASLLAMAKLDESGEKSAGKVGLLLPVARIRNPAYPVILDEEGLPRAFGHNKLGGTAAGPASSPPASGPAAPGIMLSASDSFAYTNVGIRVYKTEILSAAVDEIENSYWRDDIGYSIPGNDPDAHEFALDNVDALLASRGEARILAIANPEELTPAKSFDEIGHFEEAARKVRAEWEKFRSTFPLANHRA
ncbi:MAG TPA: hypothetical protein VN445_00140 [Rectinemataceae bacterium]|nr:hypothetical protein [Rectinemataceae bacterium]